MIEIYVWGLDVVTYDSERKKYEKWSTTCTGDVTPSPVRLPEIDNLFNWWCIKMDNLEDAKQFISEYRRAWVQKNHREFKKVLKKYGLLI